MKNYEEFQGFHIHRALCRISSVTGRWVLTAGAQPHLSERDYRGADLIKWMLDCFYSENNLFLSPKSSLLPSPTHASLFPGNAGKYLLILAIEFPCCSFFAWATPHTETITHLPVHHCLHLPLGIGNKTSSAISPTHHNVPSSASESILTYLTKYFTVLTGLSFF